MMRNVIALCLVLWLPSGCGEEDLAVSPGVTVARRVPGTGCYARMGGDDLADELALETCDEPGGTTMVGGVDRISLIIDYGPDVEFDDATTIPRPAVTLTVDGRDTTTAIDIGPVREVGSRRYFIAEMVPPATPSSNVRLSTTVAAGFDALVDEVFTIVPASVAISVVDCLDTSPCALSPTMGTARVRVTVPGLVRQTVTLRSVVDGIAQPSVIPDLVTVLVGDHTEGETSVAVPSVADGTPWTLEAQLGPVRTSTAEITIDVPPVEIEFLDCGDGPGCALTAAVGVASIRLRIPGPLPQQVDLRSFVANVPGAELIPVATTASTGDHSEIDISVPVPIAPGGSSWWIEAELGGVRAASQTIILDAPTIDADLSCGTSCAVPRGTVLGLSVTAPKDIRTRQATITTFLDGVPLVIGATLNLTAIDVEAGTISGVISVPAPATAGLWEIDVSVNGYPAQTNLVTVLP